MKHENLNEELSLGIELGSTRIKSILVNEIGEPIASGSFEWENSLIDGNWTYSIEEVWNGLKSSYSDLKNDYKEKFNEKLSDIKTIGISAMMHGYLSFNRDEELLVPFRTWRNSTTEEASKKLMEEFNYNIPQRWSIAHLYQAILNEEKHVKEVDFVTTLSGYVHWKLTGKKILGIGDASGMFPIDINKKDYNEEMMEQFDKLVEGYGYTWKINEVFPKVLVAGEQAGVLTEEGAMLLDPEGDLKAGIPICPPEGDAGTGMVATNSVRECTGNISAGTSVFAMIVLEKDLKNVYPEIDMVTTPSGNLVAMIHANNFTSDINAWVNLFKEYSNELGIEIETSKLYELLFNKALEADDDLGNLLSYGYYAGENITNIDAGRPMFVRFPNSKLNLSNFMKTHLYSSVGIIKIGMDILSKENIKIDKILGHGGFFKTPVVGQKIMSAAMNAPITVMEETAGEGGAWGIAVLALYMNNKNDESLEEFLNKNIFSNIKGSTVMAEKEEIENFENFMKLYKKGLPVEKLAGQILI